ncbi:MAG: NAD(P)-dependent alcohol dehydrogenase, partial [SAR324 cluster bacterium]|nr:NAD(P)-dependent alcohol dehydrogenase [SAR324 cluster bacterium]
MKAAVLYEYDESLTSEEFVRYTDVPDLSIESPTDVIVRV